MAHEVIHVVHRSVEAGGLLLAAGGAAAGAYLFTPTCTAGESGSSPKPQVCSNKVGTVHVTATTFVPSPFGAGGTYFPPDDHVVAWCLGGIAIGAVVGGGIGYALRELRGGAE